MNTIFQPFQPVLSRNGLQQFGLRLQEYRPATPLQNDIHSFLQVSSQGPAPYPIIPDGTQALFFSPQCVMLGGAQTRLQPLQLPAAGDYFGIRFHPGRMGHYLKLDCDELTDRFIPGFELIDHGLVELHAQVYEQVGFQQRVQVAERWLQRRYYPKLASGLEQALHLIYNSLGTIRIDRLSEGVGWSSRHLNRIFRQYTGLSPKAFGQVVRLQQVCKQLFLGNDSSLNLALEHGYFDQAHLLNDFHKYLQHSPRQFLLRFMSDFSNPV